MVRFLRYSTIFKFYEAVQPFLQYTLHFEEALPGKKLLVIAPHMDDEAIGCGGTIIKNRASLQTLDIVFCAKDTEERKSEALKCAQILKATSTTFLTYVADALGNKVDALAEDLAKVITERKPEIIFVPFMMDNHGDHRSVNKALYQVHKKQSIDCMLYAYPVWSPLYPNVLTDISKVWAEKEKAINCYKSQTLTRDYSQMSKALGQYWAKAKGREIEVAESFFKATPSAYFKLYEKAGFDK